MLTVEGTFGDYLRKLEKEAKDNDSLKKLTAKKYIPEEVFNNLRNEMLESARKGFSGGKVTIVNILNDNYKEDLGRINSSARKQILNDVEELFNLRFKGVHCNWERVEKIDYIRFWW